MVKKLPNEKKLPAEFKDCIAPLFSCLEDRNGGVRDAAKASVQYFMAHLGYEAMSKASAKHDVSSLLISFSSFPDVMSCKIFFFQLGSFLMQCDL